VCEIVRVQVLRARGGGERERYSNIKARTSDNCSFLIACVCVCVCVCVCMCFVCVCVCRLLPDICTCISLWMYAHNYTGIL